MTLHGTRTVVIADTLQVVGFMQRKGVSGVMTSARICSFVRSLGAASLEELKGECNLFTATISPGDVLYVPAGAVVGELCRDCNVGLRFPVILHGSVNAAIALTYRRRKDELEATIQTAGSESDAMKTKLSPELAVLDELLTAVNAVKTGS